MDKHKVEFITEIQQQKYKARNDQWGSFPQTDQMVIMDYTLHFSQQYQVVAEKATTLMGWIIESVASKMCGTILLSDSTGMG